jgi:hypothetical protein
LKHRTKNNAQTKANAARTSAPKPGAADTPEAAALMPTQPVASSPAANRRIKRSIAQPLRVTVYYLNFAPTKRTAPTPPAWLGAFMGR